MLHPVIINWKKLSKQRTFVSFNIQQIYRVFHVKFAHYIFFKSTQYHDSIYTTNESKNKFLKMVEKFGKVVK